MDDTYAMKPQQITNTRYVKKLPSGTANNFTVNMNTFKAFVPTCQKPCDTAEPAQAFSNAGAHPFNN